MPSLTRLATFIFLCAFLGFATLAFLFREGVSHETSVVVDAELNEVWSAFIDEEHLPEWMFGLSDVRMIEGQYGDQGSVVDFIYQSEDDIESTIRETFTKVEPHSSIEFSGATDRFEMSGKVQFLKTEDGVLVTQVLNHKGKTLLWRSFAPMMESVFETSSDGLYSNFKKYVESKETFDER